MVIGSPAALTSDNTFCRFQCHGAQHQHILVMSELMSTSPMLRDHLHTLLKERALSPQCWMCPNKCAYYQTFILILFQSQSTFPRGVQQSYPFLPIAQLCTQLLTPSPQPRRPHMPKFIITPHRSCPPLHHTHNMPS